MPGFATAGFSGGSAPGRLVNKSGDNTVRGVGWGGVAHFLVDSCSLGVCRRFDVVALAAPPVLHALERPCQSLSFDGEWVGVRRLCRKQRVEDVDRNREGAASQQNVHST